MTPLPIRHLNLSFDRGYQDSRALLGRIWFLKALWGPESRAGIRNLIREVGPAADVTFITSDISWHGCEMQDYPCVYGITPKGWNPTKGGVLWPDVPAATKLAERLMRDPEGVLQGQGETLMHDLEWQTRHAAKAA